MGDNMLIVMQTKIIIKNDKTNKQKKNNDVMWVSYKLEIMKLRNTMSIFVQ